MENKIFNKPPIKLDFHFFPRINIVSNKEIDVESLHLKESTDNYDIKTKINILQNENDPLNFQITLEIKYDNNELAKAYEFDIEVVGIFTVDESQNEEQIDKCISILGPSMLYGAAREFLLTITNRGPYPPVYLPTVSFVPGKEIDRVESVKE